MTVTRMASLVNHYAKEWKIKVSDTQHFAKSGTIEEQLVV
jgi:hypothetical protein